MFLLICPYNRVFAYPGDDITVSSHLSPETSAVSMEVRWFRGTECIYQYKNGQVSVGKGYEGRASLFIPELKRGNVSLILKSIAPMDTGTYSCQVLTGQHKVEKSIHLYMSGESWDVAMVHWICSSSKPMITILTNRIQTHCGSLTCPVFTFVSFVYSFNPFLCLSRNGATFT